MEHTFTNIRLNTVSQVFRCNLDRYHYDINRCPPNEGWEQYDTDQDAIYFGIWINRNRREIMTFAEGDESIVTCHTAESFEDEINAMDIFYRVREAR